MYSFLSDEHTRIVDGRTRAELRKHKRKLVDDVGKEQDTPEEKQESAQERECKAEESTSMDILPTEPLDDFISHDPTKQFPYPYIKHIQTRDPAPNSLPPYAISICNNGNIRIQTRFLPSYPPPSIRISYPYIRAVQIKRDKQTRQWIQGQCTASTARVKTFTSERVLPMSDVLYTLLSFLDNDTRKALKQTNKDIYGHFTNLGWFWTPQPWSWTCRSLLPPSLCRDQLFSIQEWSFSLFPPPTTTLDTSSSPSSLTAFQCIQRHTNQCVQTLHQQLEWYARLVLEPSIPMSLEHGFDQARFVSMAVAVYSVFAILGFPWAKNAVQTFQRKESAERMHDEDACSHSEYSRVLVRLTQQWLETPSFDWDGGQNIIYRQFASPAPLPDFQETLSICCRVVQRTGGPRTRHELERDVTVYFKQFVSHFVFKHISSWDISYSIFSPLCNKEPGGELTVAHSAMLLFMAATFHQLKSIAFDGRGFDSTASSLLYLSTLPQPSFLQTLRLHHTSQAILPSILSWLRPSFATIRTLELSCESRLKLDLTECTRLEQLSVAVVHPEQGSETTRILSLDHHHGIRLPNLMDRQDAFSLILSVATTPDPAQRHMQIESETPLFDVHALTLRLTWTEQNKKDPAQPFVRWTGYQISHLGREWMFVALFQNLRSLTLEPANDHHPVRDIVDLNAIAMLIRELFQLRYIKCLHTTSTLTGKYESWGCPMFDQQIPRRIGLVLSESTDVMQLFRQDPESPYLCQFCILCRHACRIEDATFIHT